MYSAVVRSAEEMEQISADRYMPVAMAGDRDGFATHFALHDLRDSTTLSLVRSSPIHTYRTGRMISGSERDDLLLFCLHRSGSALVGQHDRTVQVTPGSAVLYEIREPWQLRLPEQSTSLTLQFSREFLPLTSSQIADWCAHRLDPASAPIHLLSSYLTQLHELSDGFSDDQRQDAGHAAIDLLSLILRGVAPTTPVTGSTASAQILLGMIRLQVREQLADPRLGVEELAHRTHLSVRALHSLFAEAGSTPGAFIREQRLDAAERLLAHPAEGRRTMESIAQAVGFAELRTFERAFKRRHGTSPARWRQDHQWTDSGAADAENAARDAENTVPPGSLPRQK